MSAGHASDEDVRKARTLFARNFDRLAPREARFWSWIMQRQQGDGTLNRELGSLVVAEALLLSERLRIERELARSRKGREKAARKKPTEWLVEIEWI